MKTTLIKTWVILVSGCLLLGLASCSGDFKASNPVDDDPPEDSRVWEIGIEIVHDVLQGHYIQVDLTLDLQSEPMGGFDFLIGYNIDILSFIEAELGSDLADCGWEYFTYRYSWNGNCDDDCPSGLMRLVGLADINNGAQHPDYDCVADTLTETLATMTFFVSNDRTFECTFTPISFYWMDCGDNTLTVPSGDSLFVNRNIHDTNDSLIQNYDNEFPGYPGAPDDPCLLGDRFVPVRYVDFCNGGIDIVCAGIPNARGDINVNGLANEIADAVLFSDYFIDGLSAFGNHIEASIAASDVNADGITLTVADFVYLIRVIQGDATPYPQFPPLVEADVFVNANKISVDSPALLGAVLFVFQLSGDIDPPVLIAPGMDIKYGIHDNELRVLIYNIGDESIATGKHQVLTIDNSAQLISAELATYVGGMVVTSLHLP